MNTALYAHLLELATIADLAQQEPQKALERALAIKAQPGARELRMAVVLFCQGLAAMRRETEEAGGFWIDLSEGGAA